MSKDSSSSEIKFFRGFLFAFFDFVLKVSLRHRFVTSSSPLPPLSRSSYPPFLESMALAAITEMLQCSRMAFGFPILFLLLFHLSCTSATPRTRNPSLLSSSLFWRTTSRSLGVNVKFTPLSTSSIKVLAHEALAYGDWCIHGRLIDWLIDHRKSCMSGYGGAKGGDREWATQCLSADK
ncbi:hypothetical protein MUK42_36041 [Musa troglodytarum]|uniref:Uncharacterized protein n=1 Tax=Musa troglodytarum TaxID=320322 RepID=A0A9E7JZ84_9LILI|nr:hypothetical protein MUK42_36041 [Musa troglodytarum]